ncbi:TPA: tail fiber assembly protein [Enterobacter kobei]|nr:tail fiber assembly protein [Enterobacter kobei]
MTGFALIKDGVVENVVVWDGQGDIFDEYETVNIDGLSVGIGWAYDGKKFKAPPEPEPTHEELVEQAENQKQSLINDANNYIDSNQWPSKLALGRLSDEDKQSFNEWLDYMDALEAVDTSEAPDIAWPEKPA